MQTVQIREASAEDTQQTPKPGHASEPWPGPATAKTGALSGARRCDEAGGLEGQKCARCVQLDVISALGVIERDGNALRAVELGLGAQPLNNDPFANKRSRHCSNARPI